MNNPIRTMIEEAVEAGYQRSRKEELAYKKLDDLGYWYNTLSKTWVKKSYS